MKLVQEDPFKLSNIPCHCQSVERCVDIVINVLSSLSGSRNAGFEYALV